MLAAQADADTARISADRIRREARADSLLETLRQATLGDYEILRQIGSGGMARVFLAHDIALDRKVAIKVLLPGLAITAGTVERFKREARTAASLSHPHIIPIYVVRETQDLLYFVMQFVEGRPLEGILGDIGKLPIDIAIAVLSQVSSALHFAHRQGVIHRDVKPGNILIDNEGWAVVTDFGIAKVREAVGLTLTGSTIGTPAYMSPEQCSAGLVTGASDQYSLGVVAFEMITGRPPFVDGSVTDIMRAHVEVPPPPLAELRPDSPPAISAAIERMLAKDPEDRFPSLGAVAEALGAPPVSSEGGVRTAMREMARSGGYPLPHPVTPNSPVPLAKQRGSTTEVVPPVDAATPEDPASRKRSRHIMPIGVAGTVLVATGIIWAVTGPPSDDGVSRNNENPTPTGERTTAVALSVAGPESLLVGQSEQLRLLGGGPIEQDSVEWRSMDPDLIAVDSNGRIEALGTGPATISVYHANDSAVHQLRVVAPDVPAPVMDVPPAPPPSPAAATVATVTLTPDTTRLEVGQSVALDMRSRDARGTDVAPARVQWISDDPEVASVSSVGVVIARQPGTTRIRVVADAVEGQATVTVAPAAVARVTLDRSALQLVVADTAALAADARSATGESLRGRPVEWTTDDPTIASVSGTGVVTARAAGRTRVQARVEGITASIPVSVTAPPDPPPPQPPEDPEPLVRGVIDQYTRAIQSENLAALRSVYPDIPESQADTWRTFFQSVTDLAVETEILDLTLAGENATVRVRQVLVFRSTRRDRQESEFVATIQRGADGWHIARIH